MNLRWASSVSVTKSVKEAPSQLKLSMQVAAELFNKEYVKLEHMQPSLTRKLLKLTAASQIRNN